MNLNEHFLVQTLTEKNKELQTLNRMLFNKVASLKMKINQLETEFQKKQKSVIMEFDDFEIIDYVVDDK